MHYEGVGGVGCIMKGWGGVMKGWGGVGCSHVPGGVECVMDGVGWGAL